MPDYHVQTTPRPVSKPVQHLPSCISSQWCRVFPVVTSPGKAAALSSVSLSCGSLARSPSRPCHNHVSLLQAHHTPHPQAVADQSLHDMLFDMDGVDELPDAPQPHDMAHADMELLPDVPPVGDAAAWSCFTSAPCSICPAGRPSQ